MFDGIDSGLQKTFLSTPDSNLVFVDENNPILYMVADLVWL